VPVRPLYETEKNARPGSAGRQRIKPGVSGTGKHLTRKGKTIGRKLRICKPNSNSNRPIQTNKSCTIFWKRYSDWQTTWQNRGEPQQSRVVCSTCAPHISGPWLKKSTKRARHLRCAQLLSASFSSGMSGAPLATKGPRSFDP
jgi:hypothetical protein